MSFNINIDKLIHELEISYFKNENIEEISDDTWDKMIKVFNDNIEIQNYKILNFIIFMIGSLDNSLIVRDLYDENVTFNIELIIKTLNYCDNFNGTKEWIAFAGVTPNSPGKVFCFNTDELMDEVFQDLGNTIGFHDIDSVLSLYIHNYGIKEVVKILKKLNHEKN